MKKFKLLFIAILLNWHVMSSQIVNVDFQNKREDIFVEQIIWDIIIASPPCNFGLLSIDDNEDYWYDYYRLLSSHKTYLILKDTLFVIKPDFRNDSHLNPDARSILSIYLKTVPIISREIHFPPNPTFYKIKPLPKPPEKEGDMDGFFLGTQMFSRIAFNTSKNEAYLIQIIKRKECNLKILIVATVQDGKWRIKRIFDISSLY